MDLTTIQLAKRTRLRLSRLRAHPRQTYDQVLDALLDLVPSRDDEGEYSDEFASSLMRGLSDIRHGRTHTLAEARERLGLDKFPEKFVRIGIRKFQYNKKA